MAGVARTRDLRLRGGGKSYHDGEEVEAEAVAAGASRASSSSPKAPPETRTAAVFFGRGRRGRFAAIQVTRLGAKRPQGRKRSRGGERKRRGGRSATHGELDGGGFVRDAELGGGGPVA